MLLYPYSQVSDLMYSRYDVQLIGYAGGRVMWVAVVLATASQSSRGHRIGVEIPGNAPLPASLGPISETPEWPSDSARVSSDVFSPEVLENAVGWDLNPGAPAPDTHVPPPQVLAVNSFGQQEVAPPDKNGPVEIMKSASPEMLAALERVKGIAAPPGMLAEVDLSNINAPVRFVPRSEAPPSVLAALGKVQGPPPSLLAQPAAQTLDAESVTFGDRPKQPAGGATDSMLPTLSAETLAAVNKLCPQGVCPEGSTRQMSPSEVPAEVWRKLGREPPVVERVEGSKGLPDHVLQAVKRTTEARNRLMEQTPPMASWDDTSWDPTLGQSVQPAASAGGFNMEDPVVRRKWCTVWARFHECEYHKEKMEDQCAHACQLIRSGMLKRYGRTLIAWSVMHYNQIQNVGAEEVTNVCSLLNVQRSNHEIWTLEVRVARTPTPCGLAKRRPLRDPHMPSCTDRMSSPPPHHLAPSTSRPAIITPSLTPPPLVLCHFPARQRAGNEPLSILLQADGLGLARYCPDARGRLLTLKAPEGTATGRSLGASPSAPPSFSPSAPPIGLLPVLTSTLSAWLSTEWHAPAWLILALAVLVGGMLSGCAPGSNNGKRTKDTKPTGHHSHGSRSHGGKAKGAGGTRSPRMGST